MTNNTRTVVLLCGVALVAGFFLPWVDVGGFIKISGWDMLSHRDGLSLALLLCPLAGLGLIAAAIGGTRAARGAAFFTGGGILTYFFGNAAWGFLKTTGIGLWLVLGAAAVALVVALAARKHNA